MSVPALSRAGVDRAAHLRLDEDYLIRAWADPASRAFVVSDGETLIDVAGDRPQLVLTSPAGMPAGDRLFLGTADGTAYFAVAAPLPPTTTEPQHRSLGLREVGALLDDRESGLMTHAVALVHWHATHPYCPRCGTGTFSVAGGAERRCPADGSQHFPRVDPAVIMVVHDGGNRVVLGRGPAWPQGRLSVLAGFVEPGESSEAAVTREVSEEVGLVVSDVRYVFSQPWPFPSSLMLGFTARAEYLPLRPDPQELAEARWVSRSQLRAGEIALPPVVSIARWLLDAWLVADG
jgi:NAD+ diphosphatase